MTDVKEKKQTKKNPYIQKYPKNLSLVSSSHHLQENSDEITLQV